MNYQSLDPIGKFLGIADISVLLISMALGMVYAFLQIIPFVRAKFKFTDSTFQTRLVVARLHDIQNVEVSNGPGWVYLAFTLALACLSPVVFWSDGVAF